MAAIDSSYNLTFCSIPTDYVYVYVQCITDTCIVKRPYQRNTYLTSIADILITADRDQLYDSAAHVFYEYAHLSMQITVHCLYKSNLSARFVIFSILRRLQQHILSLTGVIG